MRKTIEVISDIYTIILEIVTYSIAVFGLFSISDSYFKISFILVTITACPAATVYYYRRYISNCEYTRKWRRYLTINALKKFLAMAVFASLIFSSGYIGLQKIAEKYVDIPQLPMVEISETDKKVYIPDSVLEMINEESSSPANPIDSFFASYCPSENTSSNVDITNFAFARADAWCVEFENAVSILKSSVNKHYGDREYIDEALEKMSADMESLTEYGSDIVALAFSSNVFVDPENDKCDEEIYEGTGAGVSRANTIADMYRSEALRLYDGILTVYENEGLDDLFIFDPDKLVETLKNKGIELVKNRIEK